MTVSAKTDHSPTNIEMQFIISCCFRILSEYDNVFVFIIRLIVLELHDVMRDAVEEVNFEKRVILVTKWLLFRQDLVLGIQGRLGLGFRGWVTKNISFPLVRPTLNARACTKVS